MGVFSEIAMEQQNSMFDSSAAFEDDEAFELEEMESLPVPPVGTDTVPVSAASVSAGETALADAEEEPADEAAPDGEEKSAEEGNSAQPPAAEDEEKKRAEHEAAEAQRKAEFDAKQQAKKAAEQEQITRLEAMSDEEVIAASTQRVSTDVEKLTRRNMKECVSEHIQMLCMEDTAFARLTMHPKKNMIRCFQYINRKAWDYVQDELKASGTCSGPGQQTYGCDVPDDMCYQWAEDYFRDPDAKEDHEDEEKFVPKPYAGKSSAKSKPKKAAEKKKTEPKAAPKQEEKSLLRMGRCRFWILGWQRQAEPAKEEKCRMIAYKGFRPGLICRGYQFVMGLNTTEKANCRENGFHCAENPLDCLSYYSSLEHSEYYIVNAGGDIDEDEHDSKIACTELTVIKRLTKEELFLHGLAYMVDHPRRVWSSHVAANRAMANCGYAVVRGKDPVATGRLGDILAFAKEAPDSEAIVQVAVGRVDGITLMPDVWYGVDLTRRTVN